MKRFLSVLIASLFLASAAYAADKGMGDEKKMEAKEKSQGDEKKTEAKTKTKSKSKSKSKAKNGKAKADENKTDSGKM